MPVNQQILAEAKRFIQRHERPGRRALSSCATVIRDTNLLIRRTARKVQNRLDRRIARKRDGAYFPAIIARHQSVLLRKLGDSDMRLQQNKVTNLRTAIAPLDGLVIPAGGVFSLWDAIGEPSKKRGFIEGMLLANGRVVEGVGGGLCQLSNFLFWIFLHADVKIVERHHHSLDVFPDSGRVLPFGSGATIFFNFLDLKMKNVSKHPLQLKMWLTDTHLKGQLRSTVPGEKKFHVYEKHHIFIKRGEKYFRYNQLWRQTKKDGHIVVDEHVLTNFAPVLYKVTHASLKNNGHELIDLTKAF